MHADGSRFSLQVCVHQSFALPEAGSTEDAIFDADGLEDFDWVPPEIDAPAIDTAEVRLLRLPLMPCWRFSRIFNNSQRPCALLTDLARRLYATLRCGLFNSNCGNCASDLPVESGTTSTVKGLTDERVRPPDTHLVKSISIWPHASRVGMRQLILDAQWFVDNPCCRYAV